MFPRRRDGRSGGHKAWRHGRNTVPQFALALVMSVLMNSLAAGRAANPVATRRRASGRAGVVQIRNVERRLKADIRVGSQYTEGDHVPFSGRTARRRRRHRDRSRDNRHRCAVRLFCAVDKEENPAYIACGFGEGRQLSEADLTKVAGLRISLSRSPTADHTTPHLVVTTCPTFTGPFNFLLHEVAAVTKQIAGALPRLG